MEQKRIKDSLPETLSSPLNLEDTYKTNKSSIINRNAQTPAQAMRPIEETSQVVPLLEQKESTSDKPDEVELEKPPRYQSNRNELSDSLASDPESAVMLEQCPFDLAKEEIQSRLRVGSRGSSGCRID